MSDLVQPTITDLNRPFWDGCASEELRLQACVPAGHLRYPISDACPVCLSRDAEWRTMSGSGEILSMVVFHRAYHPAWADRVPYNVVLVQLDEGPRLISNVLPLDRSALPAGTRVRVVFDPTSGGVILPRFVPTDS